MLFVGNESRWRRHRAGAPPSATLGPLTGRLRMAICRSSTVSHERPPITRCARAGVTTATFQLAIAFDSLFLLLATVRCRFAT